MAYNKTIASAFLTMHLTEADVVGWDRIRLRSPTATGSKRAFVAGSTNVHRWHTVAVHRPPRLGRPTAALPTVETEHQGDAGPCDRRRARHRLIKGRREGDSPVDDGAGRNGVRWA